LSNALCENHDVSVMDWKGIREASGAAIISRVEGGRGEAKGTSGSEKHAGAKNVCGGLGNVMRSEMGRDVPFFKSKLRIKVEDGRGEASAEEKTRRLNRVDCFTK